MSIYGIGVDQVDLKRVKRLLNKSEDKFLKRCFTEQEIKYAKRFSDPSKRLLDLMNLNFLKIKLIEQTFLQKGLQQKKLL